MYHHSECSTWGENIFVALGTAVLAFGNINTVNNPKLKGIFAKIP
jgi:hypothetical protein